jgi:hypothetical protein
MKVRTGPQHDIRVSPARPARGSWGEALYGNRGTHGGGAPAVICYTNDVANEASRVHINSVERGLMTLSPAQCRAARVLRRLDEFANERLPLIIVRRPSDAGWSRDSSEISPPLCEPAPR